MNPLHVTPCAGYRSWFGRTSRCMHARVVMPYVCCLQRHVPACAWFVLLCTSARHDSSRRRAPSQRAPVEGRTSRCSSCAWGALRACPAGCAVPPDYRTGSLGLVGGVRLAGPAAFPSASRLAQPPAFPAAALRHSYVLVAEPACESSCPSLQQSLWVFCCCCCCKLAAPCQTSIAALGPTHLGHGLHNPLSTVAVDPCYISRTD